MRYYTAYALNENGLKCEQIRKHVISIQITRLVILKSISRILYMLFSVYFRALKYVTTLF